MTTYIKAIVLTLLVAMSSAITFAQKVKETTIKRGKESVPGYSVKYKYGKTTTRNVIRQQMTDAGYPKAKSKKGFYTYKGILLPAISNTRADYFIKVTGNKRRSTVYLVASKGYDNYVSNTSDAAMSDAINTYLTNLEGKIATTVELDKKQEELNKLNQQTQQKKKEIKQLEEKSK